MLNDEVFMHHRNYFIPYQETRVYALRICYMNKKRFYAFYGLNQYI